MSTVGACHSFVQTMRIDVIMNNYFCTSCTINCLYQSLEFVFMSAKNMSQSCCHFQHFLVLDCLKYHDYFCVCLMISSARKILWTRAESMTFTDLIITFLELKYNTLFCIVPSLIWRLFFHLQKIISLSSWTNRVSYRWRKQG